MMSQELSIVFLWRGPIITVKVKTFLNVLFLVHMWIGFNNDNSSSPISYSLSSYLFILFFFIKHLVCLISCIGIDILTLLL